MAKTIAKKATKLECYTCGSELRTAVFWDEDAFGREAFCRGCYVQHHKANARYADWKARGILCRCGHCGVEVHENENPHHWLPGDKGCINKPKAGAPKADAHQLLLVAARKELEKFAIKDWVDYE